MADLKWDRNFALEQAGDDEEMLAELLELFRDSSASDLAKIKAGFAARDAVAVAEAAHSIKGAAASLGVEGIRKVSADLEQMGRADDLEPAGDAIAALASLLAEIENVE